jgi:hypothetical protein
MSELKLKFGEREIVLDDRLGAGVFTDGDVYVNQTHPTEEGVWRAEVSIGKWYWEVEYTKTNSPQAALDALAEKVRGHIRELWGLLGGFETEARTRKLASGVVVTDRLCRECGNILSSVMGPIA